MILQAVVMIVAVLGFLLVLRDVFVRKNIKSLQKNKTESRNIPLTSDKT